MPCLKISISNTQVRWWITVLNHSEPCSHFFFFRFSICRCTLTTLPSQYYFCFNWVWRIQNKKQIQITIWWWDKQACVGVPAYASSKLFEYEFITRRSTCSVWPRGTIWTLQYINWYHFSFFFIGLETTHLAIVEWRKIGSARFPLNLPAFLSVPVQLGPSGQLLHIRDRSTAFPIHCIAKNKPKSGENTNWICLYYL